MTKKRKIYKVWKKSEKKEQFLKKMEQTSEKKKKILPKICTAKILLLNFNFCTIPPLKNQTEGTLNLSYNLIPNLRE